ncbi:hypothetical protein WN66_05386 [Saccharomyces cerevisiae]|uniref:Putative uncharacterized protein YNL150W n=2 Tax=Saccharomyces cerevisiae TaxID=4932 RepID=YNP0_YEAST|nr:RecName: Full=Putative uncharacterized protein YNL150W [Saccharomyces cerevisiae S288C]KZV08470.1 hypothetical protein WN66_05386 [Saccharomyces cerevisiae]CAA63289.1 1773 [Saccharomyces cerevisiae]CAA96036.1 unnamed protein product [Saccharomyces cerevisiae]CAY82451.1 EC1118_1N9_2025p [Saccharomyces cerevisiae EC1118]
MMQVATSVMVRLFYQKTIEKLKTKQCHNDKEEPIHTQRAYSSSSSSISASLSGSNPWFLLLASSKAFSNNSCCLLTLLLVFLPQPKEVVSAVAASSGLSIRSFDLFSSLSRLSFSTWAANCFFANSLDAIFLKSK